MADARGMRGTVDARCASLALAARLSASHKLCAASTSLGLELGLGSGLGRVRVRVRS